MCLPSLVIPGKIDRITTGVAITADFSCQNDGNIAWKFLRGSAHQHSSTFCSSSPFGSVPSNYSANRDLLATSRQPRTDRCVTSLLWIYAIYALQHCNSTPRLFEGRKLLKMNDLYCCCFLYRKWSRLQNTPIQCVTPT